ncbi:hypothetical protein D9M68_388440 [compost metagenome]
MVGQDAVFDGPKERGDGAEQEERNQQHGNGGVRNTDDCNGRGSEFPALQSLSDDRLVELVGNLATKCGKEQERRHEDGAGQRNE